MGVYRLPPGPRAGAMAVLYSNTILLYRFLIPSFSLAREAAAGRGVANVEFRAANIND